ncbi:ABC transporter six-transmembrane domain-containing protein [Aliamphritea spongicola]|nr:ABC transporter six-transmembrane domain-containing protein [Aliamphritea spongicola]
MSGELTIWQIIRTFPGKVVTTWLLVVLENVLMACLPLLMGQTIDGLLAEDSGPLLLLAGAFALLVVVSVVRRIYDTRVYGTIKVELGLRLLERQQGLGISVRSARLDMSRELVDFLENEVPLLFTSVIQLTVSLIILAGFAGQLAWAAVALTLAMLALYACFHRRFYRLNGALNAQQERQVNVLQRALPWQFHRHLNMLRRWEVKLSDSEAWLYGGIFLLALLFIVHNLMASVTIEPVTAGTIFRLSVIPGSLLKRCWDYPWHCRAGAVCGKLPSVLIPAELRHSRAIVAIPCTAYPLSVQILLRCYPHVYRAVSRG